MAEESSQVCSIEYILKPMLDLMETIDNPNFCRFCKCDDAKKSKVSQILERLINLTIEQREMYPSIQAKIWGSIGQVSVHLANVVFHK